jgi:hypothetical protein
MKDIAGLFCGGQDAVSSNHRCCMANTAPKFIRSVHRSRYPNAGNGFGFRVARTVAP